MAIRLSATISLRSVTIQSVVCDSRIVALTAISVSVDWLPAPAAREPGQQTRWSELQRRDSR